MPANASLSSISAVLQDALDVAGLWRQFLHLPGGAELEIATLKG
jgi:hypothetical protein